MSLGPLPFPGDVAEVAKVVSSAINAIKDINITKLEEETERDRIRTTLTAFIKLMDTHRVICLKQMNRFYDEREMLFDRWDKKLELAIRTNDIALAQILIQAQVAVYGSSPTGALSLPPIPQMSTMPAISRPKEIADDHTP